jgi:hypothetical protein
MFVRMMGGSIALVVACGGSVDTATPDGEPRGDGARTERDGAPEPVTRLLLTEQASGRVLGTERDADPSDDGALILDWDPGVAPELDDAARAWFGLPSECKPSGGDVLVTASRGGVAVVDGASAAVTFYASVGGNPHSVERLPDGNLVVASSDSDVLTILVTDPEVSSYPDSVRRVTTALDFAHGLVWDAERERLWAIGGHELVAYAYAPGLEPSLTAMATFTLPSPWGHDLRAVAGGPMLVLTTNASVYLFDRDEETFAESSAPPPEAATKSVDINPVSEEPAYLVATESWWTDTLHLGGDEVRVRPGARYYKVRWWPRL